MIQPEAFMLRLADRVEQLRDDVREHQAEYNAILPHVLMADISRIAMRLAGEAHSGSLRARAALADLIAELEQGLQDGGESVEEVIVQSFLGNLDEDDPRFAEVEVRFGPQLRWEWTILGKQ